MKRVLAPLLLALSLHAVGASGEREAVLDAMRPTAARLAGQPVKFALETFNLDEQWALAFGHLVRADGGAVDWSLASKTSDCSGSNDKIFMAVAHKVDGRWTLRDQDIDICAWEPPYWHVDRVEKMGFPCDLLRNLQSIHEKTVVDECKALRRARRR